MPRRSKQRQSSTTHCLTDWHTKGNLASLRKMDRLVTSCIGGILPEQPDSSTFRQVLDIGCGSGNWAIDAALMYPTMTLVGIDIDEYLVRTAREEAEAAHVEERVEFCVMDTLKVLEFPDASFDLVNLRFGASFLRTWDWPNVLKEFVRVTRPEGMLRITEIEPISQSTSAALVELSKMIASAFFHSGHFFEPKPTGFTAHLESQFHAHGYQQVQTKMNTAVLDTKTELGRAMHETMILHLLRIRSFVQKWSSIDTREYDHLYQQILDDMQHEKFSINENFLTVWGIRGG